MGEPLRNLVLVLGPRLLMGDSGAAHTRTRPLGTPASRRL
jgi:hypothetical protein